MIAAAIKEAVELTRSATPRKYDPEVLPERPTKAPQKTEKANKPAEVIHAGNMDAMAIDSSFRQLVRKQFGENTDAFFQDATKSGTISRKQFKAALQRLGMTLSDG